MSSPMELTEKRGRIELRITAQFLGRDLWVGLSGGDREHIGAVALASPVDGVLGTLVVPRHREEELARDVAARVSAHLQAVVCVACGIHVDGLQPGELEEILAMAKVLTDRLLERLEA